MSPWPLALLGALGPDASLSFQFLITVSTLELLFVTTALQSLPPSSHDLPMYVFIILPLLFSIKALSDFRTHLANRL